MSAGDPSRGNGHSGGGDGGTPAGGRARPKRSTPARSPVSGLTIDEFILIQFAHDINIYAPRPYAASQVRLHSPSGIRISTLLHFFIG